MAERKQVMDMRSNTDGISNAESNEQQRKWSDNLWDKKAKDSLANYDPSRAHLNFEVTKGGKVQPIDTSKRKWTRYSLFGVSRTLMPE